MATNNNNYMYFMWPIFKAGLAKRECEGHGNINSLACKLIRSSEHSITNLVIDSSNMCFKQEPSSHSKKDFSLHSVLKFSATQHNVNHCQHRTFSVVL